MLRARIIPCLLVQDGGLYKTVQFSSGKYIGDPINAVKIFNEKEADELVVLDIEATKNNSGPNFGLIGDLSNECRMPLCYGGGVRSIEDAEKIISLGVEKVAIGDAAIFNEKLISGIAERVGSQSVVGILNVKKARFGNSYKIYTSNGTVKSSKKPLDIVKEWQKNGVGEILVNSVDRDGKMEGYDLDLLRLIQGEVSIPLSFLGGAGKLGDMKELIEVAGGIIGSAAGSLFVYKGKHNAVLINYPNYSEKSILFP